MRFFFLILAWFASAEALAGSFEFCGKHYDLEIVKTQETRAKGLMDRDHLDDGHGMLFVFPEAMNLNFWMKNTDIPLDIAFFDSRGNLVKTYPMKVESRMLLDQNRAQYQSFKLAQFALETKSGTFTKRPAADLLKCRLRPLPKIDASVK